MIKPVITKLAAKVREYVDRRCDELSKAVSDIRDQIGSLPVPKDGLDGKDGEVDYGRVAALVKDLGSSLQILIKDQVSSDLRISLEKSLAECVDEKILLLPKPRDGRDADLDEVRREIVKQVALAVAELPPPERGPKGEPGRDAEPAQPGAQGEPGRDAIDCPIVADFDESRVYAKGTLAAWRGGVIKAERKTDPLLDGDYAKAGWIVFNNGVHGEAEESMNDGRLIKRTTFYTDGTKFERNLTTAAVLYQGVWKEGQYEKGDMVTCNNSTWCCVVPSTVDKPGSSDAWKMAARKGNDGRDFNDPKAKRNTPPVRLA